MEVVTPGRFGWNDAEGAGRLETEARVVVEVTEQHHNRIAQGVGSPEDGMHERAAHACALLIGEHTDWAEAKRGNIAEATLGADDVTYDGGRRVLGHE